jgi:hypothetical protein
MVIISEKSVNNWGIDLANLEVVSIFNALWSTAEEMHLFNVINNCI